METPSLADTLVAVGTKRDASAFGTLLDHFGPRLKSTLMKQGEDASQAEDLVQQTMMTVWRKAELYDPSKSAPSTWIFTIARNLRIDRMRKQKVVWQEFNEETDDRTSSDLLPDDDVHQSQMQRKVQAAIEKLPRAQAEAIRLSFVEGYSHTEICEALQLPVGTVKSRLRMAYEKLRHSLEGELL